MKKHNGMITVKCECGAEILVLPDVKAMGEAIEVHITSHLERDQGCTTGEAERLRDVLIVQVLRIAGKPENEENQ